MTQEEIDKVKVNLNNLIVFNSDLLLNGNLKIENSFALLSIQDSKDLGIQIGINLMDGAFLAMTDGAGDIVSNFCCGVLSHYSNNTPVSLQSSTSSLIQRFQNTSNQFQYDLEKFYDNPEEYWDVVYNGTVYTAFGEKQVSGKLSDLATVDVPSKNEEQYTINLLNCTFGLDQQIWNTLLPNFIITEYQPSTAAYVKNGYTEQKMEQNASMYYQANPSYWRYWYYESDKGFWGGDKSAYWYINYNIGVGCSLTSDGHLSNDACDYLFSDLYNGVPNPNCPFGAGLFPREFVFNNMPNIKKVTKNFSHESNGKFLKLLKRFINI